MSHKTGKRVLTASTTLALAAVGLAAAPLTAHAAGVTDPTITELCGTTDTLTLPAAATVTRYSVDAVGTIKSLPAATLDSNGDKVYKLADLAPYGDWDNNVATPKTWDDTHLTFYGAADPTPVTIGGGVTGGPATESPCTIAVDGVGTDTGINYKVKAPVFNPNVSSPGGTIDLQYQVGAQWVVTSDGMTTVYGESSFGVAPVADKTMKTGIVVSGLNTTVALQPTGASVQVSPSPLEWKYFNDGKTDVAFVVAPNNTTDPAVVVLTNANAGSTWYVTDSSVTDAAMAKLTGTVTTAGASDGTLALKPGETKKYWLIIDDPSTKAFPDGTTSRVTPLTNGVGVIGTKVGDIAVGDVTGVDSDSFTVPSVAGVTFYYKQAGAGVNALPTFSVSDPTNVTNGWTVATEGTPIKVNTATTPHVFIAAVLDQPTTTDFASGATTGWKQSDLSTNTAAGDLAAYAMLPFTGDTIITPSAPSVHDVTGGDNDTFTFPAVTAGVAYTITAADGGGAKSLSATFADVAGKTYTRAQWASVFAGLDVIGNVTFSTTTVITGGTAAPGAPTSWTQVATSGPLVTVNNPVFSENTSKVGGKEDQILITQQDGVTYEVALWTDSNNDGVVDSTGAANGEMGAAIVATSVDPTTKLATYDVGAGAKVAVMVKPTPPAGLANPDKDKTSKTFTYQFAAGKIATAPQPIQVNKPGTADDTYTIPGATGVIWYVDGVLFDAAKVNLPQSTGGKATIVVTAKPDAGAGYTFADSSTFKNFVLDYTPEPLGDVGVGNTIISATPPTAKFEWGADGATLYTVTYHKVLENGASGPELPWLSDTDQTSANFVAMPGDKYTITVTATNDAGDETSASSTVAFPAPGGTGLVDIKPGNGTFGGSWDNLTNLMAAHNLPYFGDTAALGYTNSSWTVTLPSGSKSFDLYATVHQYGAKGLIQVNGVNWADFQTNSGYWGPVSDPYKYPVRTVSGWNPNQVVTIKVIVTENSANYVALDAYQAHK